MKEPQFTIAAVERDVGLSKDVLRVWERRYGFPVPNRDPHGERLYPAAQVLRLRLIKRLMDLGHRPGRLMSIPVEELETLAAGSPGVKAADAGAGSYELDELLALVRHHDAAAYLQAMQQRLARHGLRQFVQDTVAPLTVQIGVAWQQGRLQVFEEHMFTELTARVLRQAIATVPGGSEPRMLLTTLPKEPHEMGLLMVEAVLSLEGAQCISLGTQMPLMEIVDAVAAHQVDVVALSFSAAFPARQTRALLEQLRAALPGPAELWAGGAGVRKLAAPDGVTCMASLDSAIAAVSLWRLRAT
ncbi:MAG TPA: MerR family transcriptional regulator [Rhizobacter sp.]|nr:MerR family transcriptional regulator [Rhizobacter sp.]